ncbi:NifU N-terminal domain-containing protein [Rhodocaloribacter litoris]|uniref:NifU N-terminal domain-containing protein n=1 Tax=Rhodocaloribacter litoris TaxID=2558931 RepID=UPI0014208A76|nr:NifU N-terminal domain-containing protein [Rhodocaloribacter litoris]QXD16093.1 NifU N-terminal domain-containing protein [Rhodocaloribacter litoris]GIV59827.1 MAG: hypothetical protein KatS3mg043_0916 [Rhodothermaceae bacterium]
MPAFHFHPTPNPNSMKITLSEGTFIADGMLSFAGAEAARDHPLGAALFAVEGVTNVFILPQFLTITKTPDADWDALMEAVTAVLARHFEADG